MDDNPQFWRGAKRDVTQAVTDELLGASVLVIETREGWRVKIVWEDGEEDHISEQVFPTKDEAKKAFATWCAMVGIEPASAQ